MQRRPLSTLRRIVVQLNMSKAYSVDPIVSVLEKFPLMRILPQFEGGTMKSSMPTAGVRHNAPRGAITPIRAQSDKIMKSKNLLLTE